MPRKQYKISPANEAAQEMLTDAMVDLELRENPVEIRKIQKLRKDILITALTLGDAEARFLVSLYYTFQKFRIASAARLRTLVEQEKPHEVMIYFTEEMKVFEAQIKAALKRYAEGNPVGQWLLSNKGIGPVIASGLLSHIDIEKAPYAGNIWRFAGLDPNVTWEKGQKRPWNAELKKICFFARICFTRVSNLPGAYYGERYKIRKEYEQTRNERGDYAEQAKLKLEKFNIDKTTDAYKWYSQGKLPPGHIQARSERHTVKLLLSHLHHIMFVQRYRMKPPKPFALTLPGHNHMLEAPNFDMDKFLAQQPEGFECWNNPRAPVSANASAYATCRQADEAYHMSVVEWGE